MDEPLHNQLLLVKIPAKSKAYSPK